MKIRGARSINRKKEILSQYFELAPYLEMAYSPFHSYGMSKLVVPRTYGFTELTPQLLQAQLSILEQSSTIATRGAFRAFVAGLTLASQHIVACVINRTFDFGLGVPSINKVFPGLIYTMDVQLAKLYDPNKAKYPLLASVKYDGDRAQYRGGRFYSRTGQEFYGLDWLCEAIGMKAPILDGELMVHGKSFNAASGALRSYNETPDAEFFVFDIVDFDKPLSQRLEDAARFVYELNHPSVHFVTHQLVRSEDEALHLYHEAIDQKYEGLMLKVPDSEYANVRNNNWMKLKEVFTVDAVVTGVFEGRGKYEGMLGGVIVDLNGVMVKVGGGFSDYLRKVLWDDKSLIIGRTIEIAGQGLTEYGSMRHPRFIRIRHDKLDAMDI